MRQLVIAIVAYCLLNLFIPKLWEHLMSSAPRWCTNSIWFAGVIGCLIVAILSNPVYDRITNPRANPVGSTFIIGLILMALGAAAWWIFVVAPRPNTDVGKLVGPRFSERFEKVFIWFGGNKLELSNVNGTRIALFGISSMGEIGVIGTGFKNPTAGARTTAFPGGGTIPAVAFIRDGQLFIDAEVFAGPEQPPMQIRSNELTARPANWDKNIDPRKHALEIVNERQMPVLQIIYSDEARVTINGVFSSGESVAVVSDEGLISFRSPRLEDIASRVSKRIFKYPSWKYPGVFDE